MNYEDHIEAAINRLHEEGRYRTFIDIERERGNFPYAAWKSPNGDLDKITVWCGNDYLGMGQNNLVLEAMHEALDVAGAGSVQAGREISLEQLFTTMNLKESWRTCTPKSRLYCSRVPTLQMMQLYLH